MELFKCCRCKEKLPRESFGGKTKRADYCKNCLRDVSKEWSQRNQEKRREINNRAAAKRYSLNRNNLIDYLKTHPCVDCDETDPIVLEFDHIDPSTKRSKIANVLGSWNWDTILSEIAKCEVRCANCHRRRTTKQFGWFKGGGAV